PGNASSPRPEPSLRFGFALDIVEAPLTLQVRARSFVRALCEGEPQPTTSFHSSCSRPFGTP
ncbi:MAG: hypothetical protein WAN11_24915, partial [Syntrophobacteraceae bacterium]